MRRLDVDELLLLNDFKWIIMIWHLFSTTLNILQWKNLNIFEYITHGGIIKI